MSVKVFSIEGNRQMLDGGAMFGNAPRPVWERWLKPDELGRIPLACRAMLAQIDDKLVLLETGIGAFFDPKQADRFGVQTPEKHLLVENLKTLGFSHEDIDFVVLSHLHFDHAGGLLPTFAEIEKGNNGLLFPNAKYVVGREAWERALHPHSRDKASFIPGLTDKLKNSGRLIIVNDKTHPEVLPDYLEFRITEGHTPGHMHTLVRGKHGSVFFAGDLIPGMPWVHVPITMGYDRYPEKLIDEKMDLYRIAEPQGWWIYFTHDVEVSMAKLAKDEKGRFTGIDPQKNLVGFEI